MGYGHFSANTNQALNNYLAASANTSSALRDVAKSVQDGFKDITNTSLAMLDYKQKQEGLEQSKKQSEASIRQTDAEIKRANAQTSLANTQQSAMLNSPSYIIDKAASTHLNARANPKSKTDKSTNADVYARALFSEGGFARPSYNGLGGAPLSTSRISK